MDASTDTPTLTPTADAAALPSVQRPRPATLATRTRIVAAAREQIARSGIITLNVAAVARACDVSETFVYRQFGSRQGLLEEALVTMWEEQATRTHAYVTRLLDGLAAGEVTSARLAAALPLPGGAEQARMRLLWVQILAATATIPTLRARIAASQRTLDAAVEHAVATALHDVAPDLRATAVRAIRAVTAAVTLGYALSDLNPSLAPDDTDVAEVWADVVRAVTLSRTTQPR